MLKVLCVICNILYMTREEGLIVKNIFIILFI